MLKIEYNFKLNKLYRVMILSFIFELICIIMVYESYEWETLVTLVLVCVIILCTILIIARKIKI